MHLSHEQIQALESGEAIAVTINGARCVVLREDVYDRMREGLDDELPSPLAMSRVVASVMAEDDAQDPALESYRQYKKHP